MDKESRSRLRRVVIEARNALEEDFRNQLKRLGIEEGGKVTPVGRLQHLTTTDREIREKIIISIDKERSKKIRQSEAYDRYIRHIGFTYLNRIAALRAMELRGLLSRETVVCRDSYAGMSERAYLISEREELSNPEEIIHRCLVEAFNEVSQEINVLFDINDEYSILFPTFQTLNKVIDLISNEVPETNWLEDDIIGWIYQYYNSEARNEYRKNKRKPRADDIPVINQFYTPRWLVKALVDNTLGKLWLEMKGRMPKQGKTEYSRKEILRYPKEENVDEFCSYLIPPRQDHPPREEKSVREIKILDPACGSGHFLVYAFDVLFRMYLEAEPDTPRDEVPKIILENNLYGIDIDLRSVQLAALSLYLKAKEYNPNVRIERMNLVCADVRILDGDLQKKFLMSLEPDIELQRIFSKLFNELEYTYDVGSLLKVRQPFEKIIEERVSGEVQFRFSPKGQFFSTDTGDLSSHSTMSLEKQRETVLVKPAVKLDEMLGALLEFEKEGIEKKDMGTMLFAAETEKSVGLLSLLSQQYDVVVMNPPYGDMPKSTKEYARENYPRTHYDYYATFIEQAVDLSLTNGFIGMLTGRTFMFLKWFERVRTEILFNESRSELVFDLNSTPGDSILDEATGRWAATVVRKFNNKNEQAECIFIRLTLFEGEENKLDAFERSLNYWKYEEKDNVLYPVKLGSLRNLPRMPYSYWVPDRIAELFDMYTPLDRDNANKSNKNKIADLKVGLQTGNDSRFVRYWWEVKTKDIAINKEETMNGKKWVPLIKGGDAYYSNIPLVINWKNDGKEIKTFEKSVIRNEDYYFKKGLCWSRTVSSVLFDTRLLPPGSIIDSASVTIYPVKNQKDLYHSLLGFLNSSLLAFLFLCLDSTLHSRQIGYGSQLPIHEEFLDDEELNNIVSSIYATKRDWKTGDEISYNFTKPWLLQSFSIKNNDSLGSKHPFSTQKKINIEIPSGNNHSKKIENLSIKDSLNLCKKIEKDYKEKIYTNQKLINERVYEIYSISERDQELIEKELNYLKKFTREPIQLDDAIKPEISSKEYIERLLSYYVKLSFDNSINGILNIKETAQSIIELLNRDFKSKIQERAESEVSKILGKNIYLWLVEDYFKFHVGLYERRPIFWHLTSSNFASKRNSNGIFNILIDFNKLDKDTIPKIKTNQEYLKGILDRAKWKMERLSRETQEIKNLDNRKKNRRLQSEYEEALDEYRELFEFDKKLEEISNPRIPLELNEGASWVDRKISEIRDNGYNPKLDYGVVVNITPLKEARLLHKAADRVK
jgi:hypothetical protein